MRSVLGGMMKMMLFGWEQLHMDLAAGRSYFIHNHSHIFNRHSKLSSYLTDIVISSKERNAANNSIKFFS